MRGQKALKWVAPSENGRVCDFGYPVSPRVPLLSMRESRGVRKGDPQGIFGGLAGDASHF